MEQLRALTIVKTDIAQFTRRVEGMSSADLRVLLKGHEAAVLGPVTRYGGMVLKALGDSYLATFESSTHALLAAIGVQREVSEMLGAATPGGAGGEHGVDIRVAV